MRPILAILLLVLLLLPTGSVSAQGLDASRVRAREAEMAWQAASRELGGLLERYRGMTARIEAQKVRGETSGLSDELRGADETARRISALDERVRSLRRGYEEARSSLRSAIESEIRRAEVSLGLAPIGERPAAIARLNQLSRELAQLRAPLPVATEVRLEEILPSGDATPEELLATAAELADVEARLARQLSELDARLKEAETQQRLRRRSRELAGEEAAFDDQDGMRARGTSRLAVTETSPSGRVPTTPPRVGSSGGDDWVAEGVGGADSPEAMPDPGFPTDSFGGGAGMPGDRGSSSGGVPATSPGTPSAPSPEAPAGPSDAPEERLGRNPVEVSGGSVTQDPLSLRGGRGPDPSGGVRGEVRGGELRTMRNQLAEELERVRRERSRVLRQAEALERDEGL